MAVQQVAASPCRELSPKKKKEEDESLKTLLRMHEMGVFSKNELREIIFKKMSINKFEPIRSSAVRSKSKVEFTSPTKSKVKFNSSSPTLQQRDAEIKSTTEPTIKLQKIPRKTTETTLADMRKCVKNTTRQRFFLECTKKDSPLWRLTPGGKQAMRRLLFERAAKDVVDKLYDENPVHLRAVKEQELKRHVHWQVGRDRNNWVGKQPKRASFFGTLPPFDFVAEQIAIDKQLSKACDLTHESDCNNVVVKVEAKKEEKVEPTLPAKEEKKMSAKVKNTLRKSSSGYTLVFLKSCFTCGLTVWTGETKDCPPKMGLAYPLGQSWTTYNVQPYCQTCWGDEDTMLATMGGEHKAVGKKRKLSELKHKIVCEANTALIQNAIVNAVATAPAKKAKKKMSAKKTAQKKPAKKMQLGGWRGPLPIEKAKVKRWQVRTLCVWQMNYTSVY